MGPAHPPDGHHAFCDSEQRLVDVAFTADGPCRLTMTIPAEPNLAPPGWWMLTVVDKRRPPSNARWVHLTQP